MGIFFEMAESVMADCAADTEPVAENCAAIAAGMSPEIARKFRRESGCEEEASAGQCFIFPEPTANEQPFPARRDGLFGSQFQFHFLAVTGDQDRVLADLLANNHHLPIFSSNFGRLAA